MSDPSRPTSEGADPDAFLRVTSNTDFWLRMTGVIDAAMFEKLMDGMLSCQVLIELEFEKRFPKEHATWMAKVEE